MHMWKDNIKINHKEIVVENVDWIALTENMDQWEALVNMEMTLQYQ
jgi:hypothetical protein